MFEALDEDRIGQIWRPFEITSNNYFNKLTPMMDNREEVYDISGERFPRY